MFGSDCYIAVTFERGIAIVDGLHLHVCGDGEVADASLALACDSFLRRLTPVGACQRHVQEFIVYKY